MGIISDLFTDDTSQQTKPWKPSQPYLLDSMAGLGGLPYPEYYGGQLIANQDPRLQRGLENLYNYGNRYGGYAQRQMAQGGNMGLGAMQQGLNYTDQLRRQGGPQFQYDQNTYDTAFANLAPGVQNMFDVNARDIQRGYDYNMMPGLNMAAGMAGGYGGTKAAQQSALGQAMTAGNIQSMGANLWQNAANQANQNAMFGGAQNLASQQQNIGNVLGSYGRYAGMANPFLSGAYGMGQSNIDNRLRAGQYQQMYNQSIIDANKDRWMYNQEMPWQSEISRLNALTGTGGQFGQTQGGTTTGLGNAALQLGGAYLLGKS